MINWVKLSDEEKLELTGKILSTKYREDSKRSLDDCVRDYVATAVSWWKPISAADEDFLNFSRGLILGGFVGGEIHDREDGDFLVVQTEQDSLISWLLFMSVISEVFKIREQQQKKIDELEEEIKILQGERRWKERTSTS